MTLTARSLLALGAAMLAQVPLHAEPVVISDLVEAKAIVESVHMKSRVVLLRGDGGELDTIVAGPEVRTSPGTPGRLCRGQPAQIGRARDKQAWLDPGHRSCRSSRQGASGAEPARGPDRVVHARVQIQAIDLANRTVSFIGPARILRTLQVRDQRVLDFVRTLHEARRLM